MTKSGKIQNAAVGVATGLFSPSRTLENLKAYMQGFGWKTVYYNDGGAGDAYLKSLGMGDLAARFSAFTFCSDMERFIAIDATATYKLFLFAHEIGHIILGHDFLAPSFREEREADDFAEALLALIEKNAG